MSLEQSKMSLGIKQNVTGGNKKSLGKAKSHCSKAKSNWGKVKKVIE